MATTNVIKTRIQLKYDSISNWNSSSLILRQGEIAIAEIPSNASNSGLTPPAIGIKVGDGEHTFSQLPWIQGIAGDVYSWAKLASGGSIPLTRNANSENPTNTTLLAWLQSLTDDMDSLSGGAGSISTQISNALSALDGVITGSAAASKTLTSFSEADGVVTATFGDIQIAEDQVTGLENDLAAKQDTLTFEGTYDASTNKVATQSTISDAITALNLGTAATSDVATSAITDSDSSSDLTTKAQVAAYVVNRTAGLTGAMHFKGVATVAITDGSTTDPTITGYTWANKQAGDVVIYGAKEFVWTGSAWEELGDEGSHVLNTVTVTGSDGLTGGGALSSNQTITHAIPTGAAASTKGTSGGRTYIQTITTDKFGHITGTTTASETVTDTTYTFAEGSVNGQFTVTPSGGSAQQVTVHGLNNAAYKDVSTSISTASTTDDAKVPTIAAVKGLVSDLDSSVSATAASGNVYSVLTGVTQTDGKLTSKTEVTLSKIAKTGSIYDVNQVSTTNDATPIEYLLFDCGGANGWA